MYVKQRSREGAIDNGDTDAVSEIPIKALYQLCEFKKEHIRVKKPYCFILLMIKVSGIFRGFTAFVLKLSQKSISIQRFDFFIFSYFDNVAIVSAPLLI